MPSLSEVEKLLILYRRANAKHPIVQNIMDILTIKRAVPIIDVF